MKYKTLEESKSVNRRKCTLSEKMIQLLIRQLQHELYNHNLYRTFANWYGIQGLTLLEEYYKLRANEEKEHHDWITDYLNDCDAEYIYPEIPKITESFDDLITPFALTVDQEIETTNLIYDIIDLALEEKDWMTWGWIMNSDPNKAMLLLEQIEEETLSRTVLDIAQQENTSWLQKEISILKFYNKDEQSNVYNNNWCRQLNVN